ncbi:aminoglycoside phosphotransferase [Streptomyces sp. S1D4-20]|uniref:aminoglycoside phosphotransferase n=1 Tax=Streptomyces sp. S1D4-20 TaxID=2594462 RepID=UPI00116200B3|nr:aminoglycoside phosphotransferase [Streptomyces sp. S1D4-20]QDN54186.1 aminoglycoside phosphotransferase [Streptomyces sp. S1D4-20]
MVTTRLHWSDLPEAARKAITTTTGPVNGAGTLPGGYNSEIAVRLDTDSGTYFVKGLRTDHPRAWTQHREAAVARSTGQLAPRQLWRVQDAGWDLLGFEFVDDARYADYSADSPDLVLLADVLTTLAQIPAPPVELKRAEDRWASYIADPDLRTALAGEHLAHTDFNPENVLITHDRALMVDWAWSTRAAPWLDPALGCIWLIATGKQDPAQAEQWAARMPAWHTAPRDALEAFAHANARLWAEIADDNPGSWSASPRDAATRYAAFRASR